MPKSLTESRPLAIVEATDTAEGTIPVMLINAGWGSSGYYSEAVLKNAAKNGVFGEGLQMYIDHPGEAEMYDRPERSIRDLAATLATAGVYNESAKGIVAQARPVGENAAMLQDKEFLKAIGLSIRAYGDSTIGEAEGRKGQLITELTEAISVDFVTKAGRGGKVLVDLMESARPEQVVARAIKHGVEEATANETRTGIQDALMASYGGEKSYAWVRDFDESTVWFQYETPEGSGTFEDSYSMDTNGTVTLGGSPVEVRSVTKYVRVGQPTEADAPKLPAPAGESTAIPTEESNMAQIEDSELAQLRESADQRASAEARAVVAERKLAERDARDAARSVITSVSEAHTVTFSSLEVEGLLARVTLGEDLKFDEAAFRESVDEVAKERSESQKPNPLSGFGVSADTTGTGSTDVVREAEASMGAAFGRTVKGA